MFNDAKINVNMSGTEYLEVKKYVHSKRTKLSPQTKKALPWLFLASGGILFLIVYLPSFFQKPYIPKSQFVIDNAHLILSLSWSDIGKLLTIIVADMIPFLIILIGFAWAIHGFGFYLIKK